MSDRSANTICETGSPLFSDRESHRLGGFVVSTPERGEAVIRWFKTNDYDWFSVEEETQENVLTLPQGDSDVLRATVFGE